MLISYFLILCFLALGTAQECLQPENTSPIYVPADTLALITVNPSKGSCECSGGTEFYFASQNSSDTQYLFDNGFNDIINDCPTLCVCDINDNCYESPTVDPYPLIQLYSYCGSDGCHMRAVTFDILINKNNGTQIGYDAQFENDRFKPLSDSVYIKANRISCSKCPIQTTCPPATIVTSAPTATTTTTAMTPVCQQPANTSPICVATDSLSKMYLATASGFNFLHNATIFNNTCECPGGKEFFFVNVNSTDTQDQYENGGDYLSSDESPAPEDCNSMCFCDINDNCYESVIASYFYAAFISLCASDGCHMRAMLFEKFVNNETCAVLNPDDQLENGIYKPLNDSVYLKVNKVSCSKCSNVSTCPSITTTAITATTTTLNPTAAQPCSNQPPNTAAVYIPTASISPNGIIMKQANGSNPRSTGADYYYSPQPSADAEDLFFNEKDNVHSVCEGMCVCDIQNNCYQYPPGSTNGVWLFSICQTDGCFVKAFNPTFTPLTNAINGSQIDSNDQYVNPNELKPLTDPAYLKVSKIGCGGCSSIAAVAICPIIPITTTTIASTTTTTTLPSTTTTLVPSTTTTHTPCIQPVNTSAIYVPNDSISNENLLMFENYTASCPCEDGTELYFPPVNTSDTAYILDNNLDNILIGCENLCVCDINNNCYHFINETIASVALISYCEIDGCFMRGFILSSAPLYNVATNATISPDDQYIGDYDSKPLTDPIYLKFNRISCTECPIPQNTCQSNSTTMTPIITTTIPSSPPSCIQQENISSIYIPTESLCLIDINQPTKGSSPCDEGTEFYFPSIEADSIVSANVDLYAIRSLCLNLCICDISNNCYQYLNSSTREASNHLYSYCGNDGCYLRYINGVKPLVNVANDSDIRYPDDQHKEDGLLKPLADPVFLKVNRLSCSGCSIQNSTCPKNTVIPSVTPTTMPSCIQPANTSAIYIPSSSNSSIMFLQQANASCECSDGTEFYFTSANTSDINIITDTIFGDLLTSYCEDMCICDINDKCYHYITTSYFSSIVLFSYCGNDGCNMYALSIDINPLYNIADISDIINYSDQMIDPNTYKPITDPAFLKINKINCGGCLFQNTCSNNSTTMAPNVTTTINPQACIKPANTSAIFVSADAINDINIESPNVADGLCKCSEGIQFYFDSVTTNNTNTLENQDKDNVIVTCKNMCMCVDDDNCYKWAGNNTLRIQLYSYCDLNGCYLRALNIGPAALINTRTNETLSTNSQYGAGGSYKPINDPAFLKIDRIGCNGCPITQSSCALTP